MSNSACVFCTTCLWKIKVRCSVLGKTSSMKYKRFAKLLRIEFYSSVEFEDTQAFNIVPEKKNGSTAEDQVCCQMRLEKFLLIEITEVQGVLTTVGVTKVSELLNWPSYTEDKEAFQSEGWKAFHKGHLTLLEATWGAWATWGQEPLDHWWCCPVAGLPRGVCLGCPLWLLMGSFDMWEKRWWWRDKNLFLSAEFLVILHSSTYLSDLSELPGTYSECSQVWLLMCNGKKWWIPVVQ